ncbi:MAG: NYN domain-containing protein [Phycisphaerales bacterium]|nr:MAG: NYN domain-containing protein [Phycisphaerales bacterium]
MLTHVIIDGNNLLFAMHEHAPIPAVGRETLVRVIERWAQKREDKITLVFDGPVPETRMARQMDSPRITVKFSAPLTADDVIIKLIRKTKDPGSTRVVSSDTAIATEAKYRRCAWSDSPAFVREVFAAPGTPADTSQAATPEKPKAPSPEETEEWLKTFGINQVEDNDQEDWMV